MGAKLYQKCEQCGGSGLRPVADDLHGVRCPHCNGTGLWEIGLTMRQVEAMHDDRDRLLIALDDAIKAEGLNYVAVIRAAIGTRRSEVWEARRRLAPGTEGPV